jgi:hypothetical protein
MRCENGKLRRKSKEGQIVELNGCYSRLRGHRSPPIQSTLRRFSSTSRASIKNPVFFEQLAFVLKGGNPTQMLPPAK